MRSPGASRSSRRAERLVRLYPRGWRARYGEEFVQFLTDDILERPWAPSRTIDVFRGGLAARIGAGWAEGRDPAVQLRAGLARLGAMTAAFLVLGIAVWAQLTVSWQWADPPQSGTRAGMYLMTATLLAFGAVTVLAVLPLLWVLARAVIRGHARRALLPLAVACAAAGVIVVGSMHVGHGWPGTGGHDWSGRGLVPGPVARVGWAATLWVSSYWAHPGALATFPAAEIGWMIATPVALATVFIGFWVGLSRVSLPSWVLKYETVVGVGAGAMMAAFLAGALSWVMSRGAAPHGLFRVGVIDAVAVLIMATALAAAWRVARHNVAMARRLAVTAR